MNKRRKTKSQKIKTSTRREESGFVVTNEMMSVKSKKTDEIMQMSDSSLSYFKKDLTRTFTLTMLILALEAGLWYFQR